MNNLAIDIVKDKAQENDWDHYSQLVFACEFISHIDKDNEFDSFLEKKSENKNKKSK